MPLKKSYKKKAPRRRRAPRKMKMYRSVRRGGIREIASAQYSSNSAPLLPNASVYAFRNFALSAASTRVQAIGQAYQFFRIKKVTWEIRPAFDTFMPGSTQASVPQLYWRVDKDAVYNASTTLQTLKASGCKPIRLDDKIIRKSFTPSVLQAVAQGPTPATGELDLVLGSKRTSPWLPTTANPYNNVTTTWTPNSVDHNGLLICIDQDQLGTSTAPCAYISFTVEFEFKKPLDVSGLGSEDSFNVIPVETLAPQYVPPEGKVTMVSS